MAVEPPNRDHPGMLPTWVSLVGRDRELAFLRTEYDVVAAGAGGALVFISGDPGVGKTRLAREIGLYARQQGGVFVEGTYLRDGTAPYGPWVDALRAAIQAVTGGELRPLLGPSGGELAPLFPELAAGDHEGGLAPLAPGEQRRRLVDGLAELVVALSRRTPLLIVLNDLQWAPNLAPVRRLAHRLEQSRALIVGTYRDVELQESAGLLQEWSELNRARLATQLRLHPFLESEAAELIARYVGGELAAQLGAQLFRRTHGNAFFLEEILRSLVESGTLHHDERGWRTADPVRLRLPPSIKAVVDERVDRLGPRGRELLTHAAILGQELSFATLRALLDWTEDEVCDVVERAVAARLLVDRSGPRDERYAFADDQMQEVVYEGIIPPRRRRLHLRAARVFERLGADRPQGHVEELAWHYLYGGDSEKALTYALRAGEQAYQLAVWERAAYHFQVALDLLEDRPDDSASRAHALERLAMLDFLLGRPGVRHLEAALELFEQTGNRTKAAQMHDLVGRTWVAGVTGRTDMRRAHDHFQAGIDLLAGELDSVEKASCHCALGGGLIWYRLDVSRGLELSEEALAIAERVGDCGQLAQACTTLALSLAHRGHLDEAESLAERAWRLAKAGRDPWVNVMAAVWPAVVWPWRNDRAWMERWEERYRETRDRAHVSRYDRAAFGLVALAAVSKGQPSEAALALRRVHETDLPNASSYPGLLYFAAAAHGILGDWPTAERLFVEAIDASRRGHFDAFLVAGSAHFGRFLLTQGDWTRAESVLQPAYTLASERGSVLEQLHLLPLLAEAALLAQRLDAAAERAGEARALLETVTQPRGLASAVERALGLVATAQGETGAAEQSFQAALQYEREVGFLIGEARVLASWSTLYLQSDDEGERVRGSELLDEALAIFERCGALKDVESGRALRPAAGGLTAANDVSSRTWAPLPAAALTARERDVAALVLEGLSNRQIAEELVIAEATARTHVERILSKLGLRSRAQLAAWAVRNGLLPSSSTS